MGSRDKKKRCHINECKMLLLNLKFTWQFGQGSTYKKAEHIPTNIMRVGRLKLWGKLSLNRLFYI